MEKVKRKNGISLIVLVITILVMIILAGVVIVTMSENNPIKKAQEANFKSNLSNFNDELNVSVANKKAMDSSLELANINGSTLEEIKKYIPSFNKKFVGKVQIVSGKLMYCGTDLTEEEWAKASGILNNFANVISRNANKYYNKQVVNYTCNNKEVTSWNVFGTDGYNIFLIADDYISKTSMPKARKGSEVIANSSLQRISFNNIVKDYNGLGDIKGSKSEKYVQQLMNINPNLATNSAKTVAYLLDHNIWNEFCGEDAELAIGAPTIEMFSDSHKALYKDNPLEIKVDANKQGYMTRVGSNSPFGYALNLIDITQPINRIYCIKEINKASAAFIASPCGAREDLMIDISDAGRLSNGAFTQTEAGIRPVVVLKAGTILKENVEGKLEIVK